VTDEELKKMTGASLGFFTIGDHVEALRSDVEVLASKRYLAPLKVIAGFIYDVESGKIDDVVRWERPA
jgi:hypothetical protein